MLVFTMPWADLPKDLPKPSGEKLKNSVLAGQEQQ